MCIVILSFNIKPQLILFWLLPNTLLIEVLIELYDLTYIVAYAISPVKRVRLLHSVFEEKADYFADYFTL